jgi:hypothetical protein
VFLGNALEDSTLLVLDSTVAVLSIIACLARMEFRREGERPWPFLPWIGESTPLRPRGPVLPSRAALRVHLRVLLLAIAPHALLVTAVLAWKPLFLANVPYAEALFLFPAMSLLAGVMGIRPSERDGLGFFAHGLPIGPATLWGPRLVLAACFHAVLAALFVLALLDGTPSGEVRGAFLRAWALLATLLAASHLLGMIARLFFRNAFIAWFMALPLVALWHLTLDYRGLWQVAIGRSLPPVPVTWALLVAVALPLACLWVCAAKSTLLTLGEGRRFLAAIVLFLFLATWGPMLMTASLHEFLMTLWLEARP